VLHSFARFLSLADFIFSLFHQLDNRPTSFSAPPQFSRVNWRSIACSSADSRASIAVFAKARFPADV
jgi:hypothetical protein